MQVQRQYLTKLLGSLKPHSYGLTFSVLIAVILGVLQAYYGFLTVPHEYGHVWAAQTVGHKVRLVQIDFLDQTEGIQSFFGGVAGETSGFVTGASPPPPASTSSSSDTQSQSGSSQKAQDYSQDGKLGFVVYEPSMLLVNITSFPNLTAYNSFAGSLRPCTRYRGAIHSLLYFTEEAIMQLLCAHAEATELPSGEKLPVFEYLSEALLVAGPNATTDERQSRTHINITHHLEVEATPDSSLSTATFAVSEWRDTSNSFGLSLGPEGVTVFRSLGGPAMDMLIICSLLVLAAVLVAFGFSSAGITTGLIFSSQACAVVVPIRY